MTLVHRSTTSSQKSVIYSVGIHSVALLGLLISREQQQRIAEQKRTAPRSQPIVRFLPQSPQATATKIIPQQAAAAGQTTQRAPQESAREAQPPTQSAEQITQTPPKVAKQVAPPHDTQQQRKTLRSQALQALTSDYAATYPVHQKRSVMTEQNNAQEDAIDRPQQTHVAAQRLHAWHKAQQRHQSVVSSSINDTPLPNLQTLLQSGYSAHSLRGDTPYGAANQSLEQRVNGQFINDLLQQYIASVAYSICFSLNRDKIYATTAELPRLLNVRITIRRNGALKDTDIQQSSTHDYCSPRFYEHVRRAVTSAAPFRPLPASTSRDELELSFYINTDGTSVSERAGPITFYMRNPDDRYP